MRFAEYDENWLDYVEKTKNIEYEITEISEPLIEQFVIDFNTDEETAADKFFLSNTFAKLADKSTEFYKQSWQEIYEFLKQELQYVRK